LKRNFLSKPTLKEKTFLFAFCLGKKNLKSYKTEDRIFLHETTKLAILVFLAKKTTNSQRTKNQKATKLGKQCLTNEKNLNSPNFLLGKNRHTLKLSIHVLANREIENNQPFLLAKDPRTSNNQNIS
jgi:hypothetical protein